MARHPASAPRPDRQHAEAQATRRREDPAQNWERQGMPQDPRYGEAEAKGEHLADPTAPAPGAKDGYPDDRGEFGQHTYGQGGRRTREPYAAGRGGRGR